MKNYKNLINILVLLFLFFCVSSYSQQETKWLKGNLHTHTFWSDGDNFPEPVVKWYKDHGYNFLAISDHNILHDHDKWIEISDSLLKKKFEIYLDEFGNDWVESKTESDTLFVKLKELDDYRKLFEEENKFILIKSEEITDSYDKKPVHVNATNIRELIPPQGGSSILEVMQNNVNAVLRQREETGVPMFPHLNHPNFRWAISVDDFMELKGENFFEVYNGHPFVNNFGDSTHLSTEMIWDIVLTERIKNNRENLFGLATDDAHNYFDFNSTHSNPGRGWVMVKAADLSPEAIITAMEKGDFYASTGVEILDYDYSPERILINIKPEEGVNYTTQFIGTLAGDTENTTGIILHETEGVNPDYEITGEELYVRAKVISSKLKSNPFKEGEFETAYLQPFIVSKK